MERTSERSFFTGNDKAGLTGSERLTTRIEAQAGHESGVEDIQRDSLTAEAELSREPNAAEEKLAGAGRGGGGRIGGDA